MGRKLYVGNLPFSATEQALQAKFAAHGRVESCKLITDRDTGQSKGFGFVEMSTDSEASAAISALNGTDFEGRAMKVNEARPMEKRPGGGPPRAKELQHLGRKPRAKRRRQQSKQGEIRAFQQIGRGAHVARHQSTRFVLTTCMTSAIARASSASARRPSGVMW